MSDIETMNHEASEPQTSKAVSKYPDFEINESTFISALEAAKVLGLDRSTIYSMRERGEFGPTDVHLGPRLVKWYRPEFHDWVKAGCPNREEWNKMKIGAVNG